jgi:hypothetical protein
MRIRAAHARRAHRSFTPTEVAGQAPGHRTPRRSLARRRINLVTAVALAMLLALLTLGAGMLRSDAAVVGSSIWAGTVVPKNPADSDQSSVVLGTVFSSSTAGSVTALRFYKADANRGPHTGTVWSDSGQALATVNFATASSTGWQQATLAKPVPVTAGKSYTVSYRAPYGRYAGDNGVFSGGRTVKSGALTATAGVYTYGSGRPTESWQGSAYYVDVLFAAQTTAPATTKPPTTAPPTTAPPTTKPPTTAPPTTAPPTSGWPDAANTGVPTGTTLSAYTGPCTITAANTVIDAKTVGCNLLIRAAGVQIKRSLINGTVATDENSTAYSFTITDSDVRVGAREGTGVGAVNFTATRVEVTGGNRSMHCYRSCTIQDSFVHGQFRDASGVTHESGIRMGSGATIRHNSITCDAPDVPPDAGCSAGLTGYGDFATVQNNLIENNLFKPTTGGFCAYGGSSAGKPFSSDTRGIVFRNNVFERGSGGKCGYWGPITSFNTALPGNLWSGNTWSDGGTVPAAN